MGSHSTRAKCECSATTWLLHGAVQDERGAVQVQQLDAGESVQGPDQDFRPHASLAQ